MPKLLWHSKLSFIEAPRRLASQARNDKLNFGILQRPFRVFSKILRLLVALLTPKVKYISRG